MLIEYAKNKIIFHYDSLMMNLVNTSEQRNAVKKRPTIRLFDPYTQQLSILSHLFLTYGCHFKDLFMSV